MRGCEKLKRIKDELRVSAIPMEGPLREMWKLLEIRELLWEEEHRFDNLVFAKQVKAIKSVEE